MGAGAAHFLIYLRDENVRVEEVVVRRLPIGDRSSDEAQPCPENSVVGKPDGEKRRIGHSFGVPWEK